MKLFLIIFIGIVFITIPNQTRAVTPLPTSADDWLLISNYDGIEVFERWIENDKHLKVKERSGKMTIHCSMEEVVDLISDAKKTHLWMSNVEKVQIIEKKGMNQWFVRTVLDSPWPFGKQDMVTKYTCSNNPRIKKTIIKMEQAPNKFPKQKDIKRLDSFKARWEVVQTGKNTVKVTFTTISTKPPEYPSWMQDPVVRKVFISNLRNFKKVLRGDVLKQG